MAERLTKKGIRQAAETLAGMVAGYEESLTKLPADSPDAVTAPYIERMNALSVAQSALAVVVGDSQFLIINLQGGRKLEIDLGSAITKAAQQSPGFDRELLSNGGV